MTTPDANGGPANKGIETQVGLRDYFAAAALPGLLASSSTDEMMLRDIAKQAYEMADAMLAERARRAEKP